MPARRTKLLNRRTNPRFLLAVFLVLGASAPAAHGYGILAQFQALPNGIDSVQVNADVFDGELFTSGDTGLVQSFPSGRSARAFGSGNLSTGEMRIFAEASTGGTGGSFASAVINVVDTLTFQLPAGMSTATIGFGLDVHGTTSGVAPGALLEAGIDLQGQGFIGPTSFSEIFAAGGNVPPALIDTQIFGEIVVSDGASIRVVPSLRADLTAGTIDFSNTAAVSLTMPGGVTFTSESGGFLSQSPAVVPEPGTNLLLLGGLSIAWLFGLHKRNT